MFEGNHEGKKKKKIKQEVEDWTADAPMPTDYQNYSTTTSLIGLRPPESQQFWSQLPSYHFSNSMPSTSSPQINTTSGSQLIGTGTDRRALIKNELALVHVFPSRVPIKKKHVPNGVVLTNQKPPDHWATVHYYEGKERIGSVFMAHNDMFQVDGLTSRNEENRMSLSGMPTSSLWKSSAVRNQLGHGITITRHDGIVTLRCLTESPIFVQCPQRAKLRGDQPNTVYRLQKSANYMSEIVIFEHKPFEQLMEDMKINGKDAIMNLQNLCQTRVSFVKGFGTDYPRQTITQTPCWIEISMVFGLSDLDRIYRTVERETEIVMSSFS